MLNKTFIFIIKAYQKIVFAFVQIFLPEKSLKCSFYPTCSEYGIQALKKYSFYKAVLLIIKRIYRCHPWQKEHFDPLP